MSDASRIQTRLRANALEVPEVCLSVTEPSGRVVERTLGLAPLVIGTAGGAGLQLDDPTVSREHCEVTITERGVRVRDLGSKNGTLIAGVPVEQAWLLPGAVLSVGACRGTLHDSGRTLLVPLHRSAHFGDALGSSVPMRALFSHLERVATTNETVLLVGEPGVGKQLLARALHDASARAIEKFTAFDCGKVPSASLDAELFGHARGAFTGALSATPGVFELAQSGTLYVAAVGDLPLDVQLKLLHALERREIQRFGEEQPRSVDVRIVAATHTDLRALVAAGTFRPDLCQKLVAFEARVPPLRERKEDIPGLVELFLAELNPPRSMDHLPSVLELLSAYDWPGNVRELRNTLARALLSPADLEAALDGGASGEQGRLLSLPLRAALDLVIDEFERRYARRQFAGCGGNLALTADAMGVSGQALRRMLQRFGLEGK